MPIEIEQNETRPGPNKNSTFLFIVQMFVNHSKLFSNFKFEGKLFLQGKKLLYNHKLGDTASPVIVHRGAAKIFFCFLCKILWF